MTESEAKTLVEQHRKAGDLIDFLLKTRDENLKNFEMLIKHWTKEEEKEYNEKLDSHINELVETHKKNGDFDSWLEELSKNDRNRYRYVAWNPELLEHRKADDMEQYFQEIASDDEHLYWVCKNSKSEELKFYASPIFEKIIAEQRKSGDVIGWLFDWCEKTNSWKYLFSKYSSSIEKAVREQFKVEDTDKWLVEHYPLEWIVIRPILSKKETNEFDSFHFAITYCAGEREDWLFDESRLAGEYVLGLAKKKKDSAEYKRLMKIRSHMKYSKNIEALDKKIASINLSAKIKKIGLISFCALVVIGIGFCLIRHIATKDVREKQLNDEKQRVEKYEGKSGLKKIE
ncbi:MAG: hypothetical protein IJP61_07330 [Treponema sp.]|nr:hypothetical protein [Treponema sp.]